MEASPESRLKAILARAIPAKRWDNMALSPDSPQEEEFALHRLFGASAYRGWYFPKRLDFYFQKYALLRFDDGDGRHRFGRQYLGLIKRFTAACGGKRLLLKNPPNTGRVSLLLELFPNARFIYLNREPAEVFHSTIRMHEQLLNRFALTSRVGLDLPAFVPAFYARLQERYESEKALIPTGNLIEIAYERLVREPEQTLNDIYAGLNLPGFSAALPAFRAFIDQQKSFRPAVYDLSAPERAAIRQRMNTGKPNTITA